MENKKQEHEKMNLKGKVIHVSLCPHGTIEGVMLEDGFVKIPPHHNFEEKLATLKVGDEIEVEGEEILGKPHHVLQHAIIKRGQEILFDYNIAKKQEKPATEPKRKHMELQGHILAVGVKNKGELDRILLSGDVSVHLSKGQNLDLTKVKIGSHVKIEGEGTKFDRGIFLRANKIIDDYGQEMLTSEGRSGTQP